MCFTVNYSMFQKLMMSSKALLSSTKGERDELQEEVIRLRHQVCRTSAIHPSCLVYLL